MEIPRYDTRRCLVGLPAGQQGHRSRLGDAQVRQLQHQDQGVLGTELQVEEKARRGGRTSGGRWLPALLLAAFLFAPHALAQSQDDGFLAALGELREASYLDKE